MSLTRDQYRRITLQQKKRRRVPGGLIVHYLINVRSNYSARPYHTLWKAIARHKDWFYDFHELRRYIEAYTPNYHQPNYVKPKKKFSKGGIFQPSSAATQEGGEVVIPKINHDKNKEILTNLNEGEQ